MPNELPRQLNVSRELFLHNYRTDKHIDKRKNGVDRLCETKKCFSHTAYRNIKIVIFFLSDELAL